MEIKPIRTPSDYHEALTEIERLFDAEYGTPDGDKLDILATLVEAYEKEHFAIPAPDPIEAIEFHMERKGLSRKDLEPYIGNSSRVSEILNRKRPLTLRMIRKLSDGLDIPVSILAQEYELDIRKLGIISTPVVGILETFRHRKYKLHREFAAAVIIRRNELGISQKELANRANTNLGRIARIESGDHDYGFSVITQIAEALEISVSIQTTTISSPEFTQPDKMVFNYVASIDSNSSERFKAEPNHLLAEQSNITGTASPSISRIIHSVEA